MEKRLPLPVGTILQGRYRIVRQFGQGGFGAVYEAVDDEINLTFALKETFFAANDELQQAFKREAKILASLSHDAFPRISHYFTENGGYFLVMELIRGDDLDKLLAKRNTPFEQNQVLEWADQILDALEDLHSGGIIHRDIKPSNLKLTPKGKIKLLDFGIAKGKVIGETTFLTGSLAAATPQYAPLEQVLRASAQSQLILSVISPDKVTEIVQSGTDESSDLHALSATLYHLLTKQYPADVTTRALSIWMGKIDPLIPANQINPNVSPEVSEVLNKAMGLDKSERYQTAKQLRQILKHLTFNAKSFNFEAEIPIKLKPDTKNETITDLNQILEKSQKSIEETLVFNQSEVYANLPSSNEIIAIDFGTKNIRTALFVKGGYQSIRNSQSLVTTPNVISYSSQGGWLIGKKAQNQLLIDPQNSFPSLNRLLDLTAEDLNNKKEFHGLRLRNNNNQIEVFCPILDAFVLPDELLTRLFEGLKEEVSIQIGGRINQAVVSVPDFASIGYRLRLKQILRNAGFDLIRLVESSPMIALGYYNAMAEDKIVAVLDFGSNTFNIAILEVGLGVVEVKSMNGNTDLGGDKVDNLILSWILNELKKNKGIDLSKDTIVLQRLRNIAEIAKIDLSYAAETEIYFPYFDEQHQTKNLQLNLKRSKMEELLIPMYQTLIHTIERCIKDAGLTPKDINEVVISGGAAKLTKFQEIVSNIFGKQLNKSIISNENVVIGSAFMAAILSGKEQDILLLPVIPFTLGIETLGGVTTPMIAKNTTIPTRKSEIFSTTSDNQTSVEVHVLQGERPMASDNKTVGIFYLHGIPPAPRGVPQIEITFDIDSNSTIQVSAKDIGTGRETKHNLTVLSEIIKPQKIENKYLELVEI